MADTVSDFVLQRLRAWGVKRVFGYPGDGSTAFCRRWTRPPASSASES